MQADRVPNDSGSHNHAIDLLDNEKDNRDPERMGPIVKLNKRNQHRANITDGKSDVRNDSGDGKNNSDQKAEV